MDTDTYRNEGPLWPCGCLVGSPGCNCGESGEVSEDELVRANLRSYVQRYHRLAFRHDALEAVVDPLASLWRSALRDGKHVPLRSRWPELAESLDRLLDVDP